MSMHCGNTIMASRIQVVSERLTVLMKHGMVPLTQEKRDLLLTIHLQVSMAFPLNLLSQMLRNHILLMV